MISCLLSEGLYFIFHSYLDENVQLIKIAQQLKNCWHFHHLRRKLIPRFLHLIENSHINAFFTKQSIVTGRLLFSVKSGALQCLRQAFQCTLPENFN